jgi:PAS domain S-box-containing protein
MNQNEFDQKISALKALIIEPEHLLGSSDLAFKKPDARREALLNALEELHVAEEELKVQNDELIAMQQTLEREHKRYEQLFRFAPTIFVVTDSEGVIENVNQAFEVSLQFSVRFIKGQLLTDVIFDEDRETFRAYKVQLDQVQSVGDVEIRLQPRVGTPFSVLGKFAVLTSEGKSSHTSFIWAFQDITAHKAMTQLQLENALIQARLIQEQQIGQLKTQFMTIISHEFRNPLSIISMSNELIQHYWDKLTPESRMEKNSHISEQVGRMSGLLDHLNMALEAESGGFGGTLEQEDAVSFCERIVSQLQKTTGVHHKLVFQCAEAHIEIVTDLQRLDYILRSLLVNAIQYSATETTITLELAQDDDAVVLIVSDSGMGIPSEDQAYIFQSGYRGGNTERQGGLGLSLKTVKDFVDSLDGTITFESDVHHGTTFTVRIPTAP